MFILAAVVAGLTLGFLRGGSLRNLATIDLRLAGLVPLGFAFQVVAFSNLAPTREVVAALHLASYGIVLTAFAANSHLRLLLVAAVGTATNGICIAANGGFMPASAAALQSAGMMQELELLSTTDHLAGSVLMNEATRLYLLGDVFALPAGMPFTNVFSIGDVFIGLGITLLLMQAMVRRPLLLTGDYTAALDLIKRWPAPAPTTRPSGRVRWRAYQYETLKHA